MIDDWYSSLSKFGDTVLSRAKQYYADNKPAIHGLLGDLVEKTLGTTAGTVTRRALEKFGGEIYCENPYAVSLPFI